MTKVGYCALITTTILVLCFSVGAQATDPDETAAITFAKSAAVLALNYEQGNRASLSDAKQDFTDNGWRSFMKWLSGFLDAQGNPIGSSNFEPSGTAVVKRHDGELIQVSVPGALKQEMKNGAGGVSRTTYRVVVELDVAGTPPRVTHIETRTCRGGASADTCK